MPDRMVSVRFIRDFAPYGLRAGQERMVTEGVAGKLLNIYGVIEPYKIHENKLVIVRVIKNLSKMHRGWWPGTEHLAETSMVAPYIADGSLMVVDDGLEGDPAQAHPRLRKDEVKNRYGAVFTFKGVIENYKSGPSWRDGMDREHVEYAISLIVQDPILAKQIVNFGVETNTLPISPEKDFSTEVHDSV